MENEIKQKKQIVLSVDLEQHKNMKLQAAHRGISMTRMILLAVREYVTKTENK